MRSKTEVTRVNAPRVITSMADDLSPRPQSRPSEVEAEQVSQLGLVAIIEDSVAGVGGQRSAEPPALVLRAAVDELPEAGARIPLGPPLPQKPVLAQQFGVSQSLIDTTMMEYFSIRLRESSRRYVAMFSAVGGTVSSNVFECSLMKSPISSPRW